jgi:hypothetical protein
MPLGAKFDRGPTGSKAHHLVALSACAGESGQVRSSRHPVFVCFRTGSSVPTRKNTHNPDCRQSGCPKNNAGQDTNRQAAKVVASILAGALPREDRTQQAGSKKQQAGERPSSRPTLMCTHFEPTPPAQKPQDILTPSWRKHSSLNSPRLPRRVTNKSLSARHVRFRAHCDPGI